MPDELSQTDIDSLLANAAGGAAGFAPGPATALELPPLPDPDDAGEPASIDRLYDVELEVKIELGRTLLSVEDILRLGEGSIVQLDKDAGAPVDILINNRLVAEGEVLVLNDYFCVRVTNILSNKDRAISKATG